MSALKRAMKFQRLDLVKSVGVFWLVMLILNIASFILNLKLGEGTIFYGIHHFGDNPLFSIAGANVWPAFIFFIVYCYEMYYEYFPIAASFSITRSDFYKSALIDNLIVAAFFAVIQGILMKLDIAAVKMLDITPLTEFGIFNTATDNIMTIVFSLFAAFLFVAAIMNLVALLNYKFGWKMWIVLTAISSLLLAFGVSDVFNILGRVVTERIDLRQLLFLVIPIIISYLAGFVVVRNTNIKNRIG